MDRRARHLDRPALTAVLLLVATACGALACSSWGRRADASAARSGPARGDAIVAENGGDVWDVNTRTGRKRLLSSNAKSKRAGGAQLLGDLYGIARERSGSFVVIARRGSPDPGPNPHPSRVIRINQRTGAQRLISASPKLHYNLVSLAISPTDGQIYVGDENVPDDPYFGSVIWRVNPRSGRVSLVANNTKSHAHGGPTELSSPLGMAFSPRGQLFVMSEVGADPDAPDGVNDNKGALLAIDRRTGKQTAILTSNYMSKTHGGGALFDDPRSLARAANGDFYVVDDAAVNDPSFGNDDTQLIRINPRNHRQALVSDNATSRSHGGKALFQQPYGVAVQAYGKVLVVDQKAGTLIRVDPASGRQSLVARGLGVPISLVVVP